MAEVWRGKMFGAGGFERLVAIKRILPNIAEDEEFITMFIDEAKITVQLNHANVAQVYELGNIANNYFIAMEYIAGKDMRAIFDRCRKKGEPAPIPLTCYTVAKMCEGLDYAHRKKDNLGREMNIVHRDISPQNVLVSYEGEVKVIDFGIAKAAGKATKTQAGILKGKFAYMSPEQIRGLPLDRRSDIFAIGICLYEMLTGERLFVGDSDFSVLEKVRKAEVLPPSTFNRRIPEGLEKIVLKALAKDVEDRYQYASDLADDLQKFLITSDSIFSRKDLMQYMKSTFAEDVEREKLRLQEYAEIKPPEGMLAALEMGIGSAPVAAAPIQLTAPASSPRPSVPAMPAVQSSSPRPSSTGMPAAPPTLVPGAGADAGPRRSPSLASMPVPKLTAAAPMATNAQDDEGGATVLVDGSEYFKEGGSPAAADATSPTLTPAAPQPVGAESSPPTAVVGPPQGLPPGTDIEQLMNAPTVYTPPAPTPPPSQRPGQRITGQQPAAAAAPARRSQAMPAMGRPVAPAPAPEEDADDEKTATNTAPSRPAPARAQEAAEVTSPSGAAIGTGGKMKIYAGVAAALVLILVAVGVVMFRGPGMGALYIKLPKELAGKARVNINGRDLPPEKVQQGDLLEQVEAGTAAVMIAADGWETYTGTVEVKEGNQVTRLEPKFKRVVQSVQLVLVFEPEEAEVRLDDKVVKQAGMKSGPYIGELPSGSPTKIDVRMEGYESWSQKVVAQPGTPTTLNVKLTPLTFRLSVTSEPVGANVYANGRALGQTPALVDVPYGTHALTFKKKCFADLEVPLQLPAEPPVAPQPVSARLVRQPNCR
ncbi:MAG: protein kinase [Myxococcaceae bacterium]|nr:protein kinase [Myxococcaceae bacterium]